MAIRKSPQVTRTHTKHTRATLVCDSRVLLMTPTDRTFGKQRICVYLPCSNARATRIVHMGLSQQGPLGVAPAAAVREWENSSFIFKMPSAIYTCTAMADNERRSWLLEMKNWIARWGLLSPTNACVLACYFVWHFRRHQNTFVWVGLNCHFFLWLTGGNCERCRIKMRGNFWRWEISKDDRKIKCFLVLLEAGSIRKF